MNFTYTLSIEVSTPLDCVVLQSDVNIDVEDADKNNSLISKSPISQSEGTQLLATCRILQQSNRVSILVRTVEGQAGTLLVYVIPQGVPKAAQTASYSIKPLSLHYRVNEEDVQQDRYI